MNTFKKLLIGTAIAATAATSQAAIIDGSLGDGEFFVILSTLTNNNSLIVDLGKTISTFDTTLTQSFNLAASPFYSTFISNNTANDPIRFGVIAANSLGATTGATAARQLFVSAPANSTPTNLSNSTLGTRTGNLATFIGSVNGQIDGATFSGNHSTTTDGSSLDTSALSSSSYGQFAAFEVFANGVTMVNRGSSAELFRYASNASSGALPSTLTDFFSATETPANLGAYFTLSNTGALDFTGTPSGGPVVNPIPEASEWAMMLSGLAMVGLMVRRRRNNV